MSTNNVQDQAPTDNVTTAAEYNIYPAWTGLIGSIEAMRVAKVLLKNQRWHPPRPDHTFPNPADPGYHAKMEGFARRLFAAMNSKDPAVLQDTVDDSGNGGNRMVRASYDQAWVECQAWELLAAAIDLHTNGAKIPDGIDIPATIKDKMLLFQQRIVYMERTLRESKAACDDVCDDVCAGNKILQFVQAPTTCYERKSRKGGWRTFDAFMMAVHGIDVKMLPLSGPVAFEFVTHWFMTE